MLSPLNSKLKVLCVITLNDDDGDTGYFGLAENIRIREQIVLANDGYREARQFLLKAAYSGPQHSFPSSTSITKFK